MPAATKKKAKACNICGFKLGKDKGRDGVCELCFDLEEESLVDDIDAEALGEEWTEEDADREMGIDRSWK